MMENIEKKLRSELKSKWETKDPKLFFNENHIPENNKSLTRFAKDEAKKLVYIEELKKLVKKLSLNNSKN